MTDQSYARQRGFVEKAEEEGKLVYKGEMDDSTRRMGFSLVKLAENGVGETGGLVEEEIFGAVVPIIPVSVRPISTVTMRLHDRSQGVMTIAHEQNLDKAIEWINARPHPLALYVCSSKRSTFDMGESSGRSWRLELTKVVERTTSGSATWNDFCFATLGKLSECVRRAATDYSPFHAVRRCRRKRM